MSERETLSTEEIMEELERSRRYRVFTRTWWRSNPAWPGGREPGAGRKSYRGHPRRLTFGEAREYCLAWNESHNPGKLSRKAEFEEE